MECGTSQRSRLISDDTMQSITGTQIAALIESYAPCHLQEDWDNSGWQIAQPEAVSGILVCLDVSEAVLQEALDKNCNLVVSHHPLLFKGLKRIDNSSRAARCLQFALQHGIGIYSAHTNLDKAPQGLSFYMARRLHLQNIQTLTTDGYGCLGELTEPQLAATFLSNVKQAFNCQCVRYSGKVAKIHKVAVCSGSGADFMSDAQCHNADAYLTGDLKYHQFDSQENGMLLVDIGHYESEQCTKELFFELFSKKFTNFAVQISQTDKNPIHIL